MPLVWVSAPDPVASEREQGQPVDQARFRIHRTTPQGSSGSLTIKYAMSGTATFGLDYESMPLSATIPDGQSYVDVYLTAIDDHEIEGTELVYIRLVDIPTGSNRAFDLMLPSPAVPEPDRAFAEIRDNDARLEALIVTDPLRLYYKSEDHGNTLRAYDDDFDHSKTLKVKAQFPNGWCTDGFSGNWWMWKTLSTYWNPGY